MKLSIQMAAFIALVALSSSAFAFQGPSVPSKATPTASISVSRKNKNNRPSASPLSALIYGWDGQEEDSSSSLSYTDFGSDLYQTCSPVGSAVAEALSYDQDRSGHLARLAVAFSPPERALSLNDIQNVEVVCVREDHIEIQAIICEDGGCVSLSVPVTFPRDCYAENSSSGQLEGCVIRNLDELNETAGSLIQVIEETKKRDQQNAENFDDLCQLNEQIDKFPSWWVPPECDENLAADCEHIRQLLNEDEFQPDINALAQDSLRKLPDGADYKVLQSKVAVVGPAGICFKARAEYELSHERPIHILDVVYPFGGEPMKTVESLRAAVLGAVAAAEGD